MGSGVSGLYTRTHGSLSAPGSTDYMSPNDSFSQYIRKRKDIDIGGFYDIIAHGNPMSIEIQHNGKSVVIDHRIAAKLFKSDKNYNGQGIRLLSCSTGKLDNGFAQNLANKLNIPVKAPTDILWATPAGTHYVASGILHNGRLVNDLTHKGTFKTFYPQRRSKK